MSYIVKVKRGNRILYGKRVYKTLAGAKKSIASPSAQTYIKQHKLKNVRPVKQRKLKI